MRNIRVITLFIPFLSFNILLNAGFSQEVKDEKKNSLADDVQRSFEKAIRNIDSDKQNNQEKLKEELRVRLNLAVQNWVASINKKRESELGKAVNQNWERLSRLGPYIHYEYYLRDYAYSDVKTDIIATESLNAPFRAYYAIIEKLDVEKEHAPHTSFRKTFFYTATMPIRVNFHYREGTFVEEDTEYGQTFLGQGWPEEVVAKLKLFE